MSDVDPFDLDGERDEALAQRERANEFFAMRRDTGIITLMSEYEGRCFVYSLLQFCHVYATSFSSDLAVMAKNEGERNVGLFVMAELQRLCPEQYGLMLREATQRGIY